MLQLSAVKGLHSPSSANRSLVVTGVHRRAPNKPALLFQGSFGSALILPHREAGKASSQLYRLKQKGKLENARQSASAQPQTVKQ